MKHVLSRILLGAALLTLIVVPVAAAQTRVTAPVAEVGMDVQMWPEAEPGQTVVITSVTIAENVKLPVTVRVPTVEGMQVQWVGEISGGSQDPTRTYTTEKGDGGDYVQFEVSQYREAQVEMIGLAPVAKGERTSVTMPWVQSAPSTLTAFSVRTIAGVRDVRTEPKAADEPGRNEVGEALYTLPSQDLEVGEKLTVSVSYASGTEFEGGLDGTGNSNIVLWVLLGGIVVAAAFLVWTVRRHSAARSEGE